MEYTPTTNQDKKVKIKIVKLNYKSFAVVTILLLQIAMEYFRPVNYLDEAVGVFAIGLMGLMLITGKVKQYDLKTVILIFLFVLITLFSNIYYGIVSSWFSIGVDALTQIKALLTCLMIRAVLTDNERQTTIDYLYPLARIFFPCAFVFSLLSQFFSLGKRVEYRYGLRVFTFIFPFAHQYSLIAIFLFGVIVCTTKMSERSKRFYYAIGLVSIALNLKSAALFFAIIFIGMYVYFQRYEHVSIKLIIPMAAILIYAGQFQIQEYLMDDVAPRRIFFDYAIRDANEHFPFGSGFATFGSAEAAKNYSPLYYTYGFDGKWGMTPDNGAFLHDNYWQGLIGQSGWIGTVIFLLVYVRIFLAGFNSKAAPAKKALLFAQYISIIALALGSAAITSSPGLIVFTGFALFSDTVERKPRIRLNIKF